MYEQLNDCFGSAGFAGVKHENDVLALTVLVPVW